MDFLVLISLYMSLGVILSIGVIFRWMPLMLLAGAGFFLLGVTVDSISTNVYAQTGESQTCTTPEGTELFQSEHTISTAVASSEQTETYYDVSANDQSRPVCSNCSARRAGVEFGASSSLIGDTFDSVTFRAKKTGSPTGTATIELRENGEVVKATTNFDVATLTASYADYTVSFSSPATIASGDRLLFVYTGGSAGTHVDLAFDGSAPFDGANTKGVYYTGAAYADFHDTSFEIERVLRATNVKDSSVSTYWQNNADIESGAYIYVDVGSAQSLYGMKINHQDTTKIIDQYAIAFSNSTTFSTISDLFTATKTTGYQNHVFNEQQNARYMRLSVNDWGAATRMQITELELWTGSTIPSTEPETCTTTISGDWVENDEPFAPEFRVISALGGSLMILAAALIFMRSD